ncbi:MAG TPA: NHL repeat-containing protein [Desulfuromonadaceae bacterium]|nr:NHL repeat-containing protein [Desulfuromonadaceae bacterium]
MRSILTVFVLAIGMGMGRSDSVYVASFFQGTVEKFSSNGVGTPFVSNLNAPEQITFDSAGNLYVANYGNNTVIRYTTNGSGSVFATVAGGPNGLAFDSRSNLYVATFDGGTIEKYSAAGVHLSTLATGLSHPIGLVFDRADNLYVSMYDNVILRYTTNGTGSVFAGGLNRPIGMAFDAQTNLYVANFGGASITKLRSDGAFLGVLPTTGLSGPYFVGFDSSTNLYVANFTNGTVQKITAAGVESTFATMSSAAGLAVWPGLSWSTNSVTVSNAPPFGFSLKRTAPGQMTLRFFGSTNTTFTVVAATNMSLPRTNWTVLGTATLQSSNLFQFIDTHATNVARFYTVRSP